MTQNMTEKQRQHLLNVFCRAREFLRILIIQKGRERAQEVAKRDKCVSKRSKQDKELHVDMISRIDADIDELKALLQENEDEIEKLRNGVRIEEPRPIVVKPDRRTEELHEYQRYTGMLTTIDVNKAIGEDYNHGMSPEAISKKYGITLEDTIQTVRKLRRNWQQFPVDDIADDCNAGMSDTDIAHKYELTIGQTIEILRKLRSKGRVTWGKVSSR